MHYMQPGRVTTTRNTWRRVMLVSSSRNQNGCIHARLCSHMYSVLGSWCLFTDSPVQWMDILGDVDRKRWTQFSYGGAATSQPQVQRRTVLSESQFWHLMKTFHSQNILFDLQFLYTCFAHGPLLYMKYQLHVCNYLRSTSYSQVQI